MQKPDNIYGIHDPGGEHYMLEANTPGWIVFTESVGCDPNDNSGRDYRQWSDAGLGALVRLNYGYEPMGTLPYSNLYGDFARRCANFVANSKGCSRWIIGNEMNYAVERPGGRKLGRAIYPWDYSFCYMLCREAIRTQPGHGQDEVLVGAVAPWNAQTTYANNGLGDWVQYLADILRAIEVAHRGDPHPIVDTPCDGITLHTYTHTPEPWRVYTDTWMNTPFQDRHYDFLAYRDFMEAIPGAMRHLPVYITETDQDVAWLDDNSGWVERAYGEINWWNQQPGYQKILALCLYRWPRGYDKWGIEGKEGVIADFRNAMRWRYTWR